ncbi:unnamed protein product [Scytosiphon promiscuus]
MGHSAAASRGWSSGSRWAGPHPPLPGQQGVPPLPAASRPMTQPQPPLPSPAGVEGGTAGFGGAAPAAPVGESHVGAGPQHSLMSRLAAAGAGDPSQLQQQQQRLGSGGGGQASLLSRHSPASRMMAGSTANSTTSAAASAAAVAGAGAIAPAPPPPVPRPRQQTVDAENVFQQPGRRFRPDKICIILRGLPGSGKSHVARLLRDVESEAGGQKPRVLSIDDYYMNEVTEEKTDERGVKRKVAVMKYQHDVEMEELYQASLLRAVKKTAGEGLFPLFVVDSPHYSRRDLEDVWGAAKRAGFEAFVVDLFHVGMQVCLSRDIHGWGADRLKEMLAKWEPTPEHMILLDVKKLTGEVSTIDEVDMSDGGGSDDDDEVMKDDSDSSAAATAAASGLGQKTSPAAAGGNSAGTEGCGAVVETVGFGGAGVPARQEEEAEGAGRRQRELPPEPPGAAASSPTSRGSGSKAASTSTSTSASSTAKAKTRRWEEDSDSDDDDDDGRGSGRRAFSDFFSDDPQGAERQAKKIDGVFNSGRGGGTGISRGGVGGAGVGGGGGASVGRVGGSSGIGNRTSGKGKGGSGGGDMKRRKKREHSSSQHALSVGARTPGGFGEGFWREVSIPVLSCSHDYRTHELIWSVLEGTGSSDLLNLTKPTRFNFLKHGRNTFTKQSFLSLVCIHPDSCPVISHTLALACCGITWKSAFVGWIVVFGLNLVSWAWSSCGVPIATTRECSVVFASGDGCVQMPPVTGPSAATRDRDAYSPETLGHELCARPFVFGLSEIPPHPISAALPIQSKRVLRKPYFPLQTLEAFVPPPPPPQ